MNGRWKGYPGCLIIALQNTLVASCFYDMVQNSLRTLLNYICKLRGGQWHFETITSIYYKSIIGVCISNLTYIGYRSSNFKFIIPKCMLLILTCGHIISKFHRN